LVASGIATATPAGADESMKTDLHKLRVCESGDNWAADTGNGYFGAYQFAKRTWHSLGYSGRPDHASHSKQTDAAKQLHSEQGWNAWPSCSQAEHLG
jgi:hypothetical protein